MQSERVDAWEQMNDSILKDGYVWEGSVMLPSDSWEDGVECPGCGKGGFWVVLYVKPDDKDNCVSANQCYNCGHIWRED